MTPSTSRTRTTALFLLFMAVVGLTACGGGDGGDGAGDASAGGDATPDAPEAVDLDDFTYVSDGTFDGAKAFDILRILAEVGTWSATRSSPFIDDYDWHMPRNGDQGRYSQDMGFDEFFGEITWVDTGKVGPFPAAVVWTHHTQYDTAELIVITGLDSYIHEIGDANSRLQTTYAPRGY